MPGVAMTHLPMRLEPPDARSRRCQHLPTPGGRTCALRRLGPHAHSAGWTPSVSRHGRRCLHEPPPERRRPAQEATPCAGQRSSCRCALRAGRSPSHRVASCACASSAADLTPGGCGPVIIVQLGPHRRLDRASMLPAPPALRRPAGAGAPSASAPGPAGAARRPAATAPTHPPALPRKGSESALCRQRCMPLRPHAPPHGERRTARLRVKAAPFGWPAASLDSAACLNAKATAPHPLHRRRMARPQATGPADHQPRFLPQSPRSAERTPGH